MQNVIGICKTESSRKPVPAHENLVEALREWHGQTPYQTPQSWVFASPVSRGRWPYLAQEIMRHHIRPAAGKLRITKRIGWHTFRHTYSTLLRSTGAELTIMQELLRHSTIRVTLDTYTQAVTTEKRIRRMRWLRFCSCRKYRNNQTWLETHQNLYLCCAFLCLRQIQALRASS